MTTKKHLECNGCGKLSDTDNLYKEGWIYLRGQITKGFGKYNDDKRMFFSQFINDNGNGDLHFCCWQCLVTKNDNKTPVITAPDNLDDQIVPDFTKVAE